MITLRYLIVCVLLCCAWSCKQYDYIDIEGVEIISLPACLAFNEASYIAQNDTEMNTLLRQAYNSIACDYLPLAYLKVPDISFEERSLLAQRTRLAACSVFYEYEVKADVKSRRYIYNIYARKNGDCSQTHEQYHWISLPKIPQNYTVSFQITEI